MQQTTHQTVVEHTALETVHKRDEDGRIIDTYTVRMRWEDVVEEKRALSPTLRSGKLERAKARYRGQPLPPNHEDDVFGLVAGEIFVLEDACWRRELNAVFAPPYQIFSVRAAKRRAKAAQ